MFKRASLLAMLIVGSTSGWSAGAYVGIGGGFQAGDYNQDSTVAAAGNFNVKVNSHLSGTGEFGTLFAGYGWTNHLFYLAGEANADGSSVQYKSYNDELLSGNFSSTHYRIRHSVGLSVLPGYLVNESTLLFARLGYSYANFNIATSDISIARVNKYLSGVRFGVGMNETLSQQLSLRMEYGQIYYRATSFTMVDGPVSKYTSISPTVGQIEFSLIYHFA